MKILKRGSPEPPQPIGKIACPRCRSELEYSTEDVFTGEYGDPSIKCPVCGTEIVIDSRPTVENVYYPDDFIPLEKSAKKVNNEEITKTVRMMLKVLRDNSQKGDGDYFMFHAGGDTAILVIDYPDDEDYYVLVTHGYEETVIDYEDIDYITHEENNNNE